MSGSSARPMLAWPMVPDELDQVFRLQEFRTGHPDVIIEKGEFGTWQARIPHPSGETITIRYTLRELLDRLCELLAEHHSGPGRCPSYGSPAT